jgi:hypothetical protein
MLNPYYSNNSEKSKKPAPVYTRGRVVGSVKGGTFFKSIKSSGYLRVPPGIAFSVESLAAAEAAGAVRVQVTDKEDGTIYRATIEHIRAAGFPVNRPGYEPQIGLSFEGFTRQRRGDSVQPSLFDANRREK